MSNRFWASYRDDLIPLFVVLIMFAVIGIPTMIAVKVSNRNFDARERRAETLARTPQGRGLLEKVVTLKTGNIVVLTKCEEGPETIGYVDADPTTVTVRTKYGLCWWVDLKHMQDILPLGRKITKVVRYGDPDYAKAANQIFNQLPPPRPKETSSGAGML